MEVHHFKQGLSAEWGENQIGMNVDIYARAMDGAEVLIRQKDILLAGAADGNTF